jgi:hypothetical protein
LLLRIPFCVIGVRGGHANDNVMTHKTILPLYTIYYFSYVTDVVCMRVQGLHRNTVDILSIREVPNLKLQYPRLHHTILHINHSKKKHRHKTLAATSRIAQTLLLSVMLVL